jgi:hypothetical protein
MIGLAFGLTIPSKSEEHGGEQSFVEMTDSQAALVQQLDSLLNPYVIGQPTQA